jgi:hypothetical protein
VAIGKLICVVTIEQARRGRYRRYEMSACPGPAGVVRGRDAHC